MKREWEGEGSGKEGEESGKEKIFWKEEGGRE